MRPRVTMMLIGTLVAPAALSGQRTVDGWRYAMTITTDSGDGHPHITTTRHVIAEGLVRTEFTSNDRALSALTLGSYMVVNAKDSTIISVLPSQQMATIMVAPSLNGTAADLPSFVTHGTSSTQADLGPGEKILGHDTHRYRTTTSGSFDATINGQTCTRTMNGTTEAWLAADVDPMPMLETEMRAYGRSLNGRLDSLRKQAAIAGTPKGFALRTIRTETGTDSTGRPRSIVTTMEYTELDHGPIDPSLFEAPLDYRVMDMRTMPAIDPQRLEAMRRSRPNPLCPNGR